MFGREQKHTITTGPLSFNFFPSPSAQAPLLQADFHKLTHDSCDQYELSALESFCWTCSYLESRPAPALTNSSGGLIFFFPPLSLGVTTTYRSSLKILRLFLLQKSLMKPVLNITIHSLFFFFQNNKNSLTNKDFFILSIWTCIYRRWN